MMKTAIMEMRRYHQGVLSLGLPVLRNLVLITAGSIIYCYGMNAIMMPARLFSGGLTGVAILLTYRFPSIDLGQVYLLLNLPMLMLGWFTISKRFIAYSIYGIAVFSLAASIVHPPPLNLSDPLLAALAAGVVCGLGNGLILRSLGSAGGMDILAIFLNKRWGARIGSVYFAANAAVILAGGYFHELNAALYSTILLFVGGSVINSVIGGFNARLSLIVVSDRWEAIAELILKRFNRGVTFLDGEGAYSRMPKRVIFTITTRTELSRIKEMIFREDGNAFVVVNNTLEVLGQRHGSQRVY